MKDHSNKHQAQDNMHAPGLSKSKSRCNKTLVVGIKQSHTFVLLSLAKLKYVNIYDIDMTAVALTSFQ